METVDETTMNFGTVEQGEHPTTTKTKMETAPVQQLIDGGDDADASHDLMMPPQEIISQDEEAQTIPDASADVVMKEEADEVNQEHGEEEGVAQEFQAEVQDEEMDAGGQVLASTTSCDDEVTSVISGGSELHRARPLSPFDSPTSSSYYNDVDAQDLSEASQSASEGQEMDSTQDAEEAEQKDEVNSTHSLEIQDAPIVADAEGVENHAKQDDEEPSSQHDEVEQDDKTADLNIDEANPVVEDAQVDDDNQPKETDDQEQSQAMDLLDEVDDSKVEEGTKACSNESENDGMKRDEEVSSDNVIGTDEHENKDDAQGANIEETSSPAHEVQSQESKSDESMEENDLDQASREASQISQDVSEEPEEPPSEIVICVWNDEDACVDEQEKGEDEEEPAVQQSSSDAAEEESKEHQAGLESLYQPKEKAETEDELTEKFEKSTPPEADEEQRDACEDEAAIKEVDAVSASEDKDEQDEQAQPENEVEQDQQPKDDDNNNPPELVTTQDGALKSDPEIPAALSLNLDTLKTDDSTVQMFLEAMKYSSSIISEEVCSDCNLPIRSRLEPVSEPDNVLQQGQEDVEMENEEMSLGLRISDGSISIEHDEESEIEKAKEETKEAAQESPIGHDVQNELKLDDVYDTSDPRPLETTVEKVQVAEIETEVPVDIQYQHEAPVIHDNQDEDSVAVIEEPLDQPKQSSLSPEPAQPLDSQEENTSFQGHVSIQNDSVTLNAVFGGPNESDLDVSCDQSDAFASLSDLSGSLKFDAVKVRTSFEPFQNEGFVSRKLKPVVYSEIQVPPRRALERPERSERRRARRPASSSWDYPISVSEPSPRRRRRRSPSPEITRRVTRSMTRSLSRELQPETSQTTSSRRSSQSNTRSRSRRTSRRSSRRSSSANATSSRSSPRSSSRRASSRQTSRSTNRHVSRPTTRRSNSSRSSRSSSRRRSQVHYFQAGY